MTIQPVHVRIICPVTLPGARPEAHLRQMEHPGLRLSVAQISEGPLTIETEVDAALAIPSSLRLISRAAAEGVDAVVIDCMGDPGMRPGRELVRIPVIGPAQASMHVAAMLGHRFSVVTIARRLRAEFENNAAVYGLAGQMASCRSIGIPVAGLSTDLARTLGALTDEAQLAVERDGAEAIIFGCTGLFGCAGGVAQGLRERGIDVPVIDPIPTAVNLAAALVRAGLSHSALTYPPP